MMAGETILEVRNLRKDYPSFTLDGISFDLHEGEIMGLIGRNGAGKTTTIKAILNLIHATGSVRYFGLDLHEHETAIKQRIGYAAGAIDWYRKRRIRDLVAVTRRFYDAWDDAAYTRYMGLFELDDAKTPAELSQGMKVKLNLALALSHGARLLILDEPTSGIDPVSRDEMLEIFRFVVGEGAAILYSTHITSDLEKCADSITYIREGRQVFSGTKEAFLADGVAKGLGETLEDIMIAAERQARHARFDASAAGMPDADAAPSASAEGKEARNA